MRGVEFACRQVALWCIAARTISRHGNSVGAGCEIIRNIGKVISYTRPLVLTAGTQHKQ